MTKWLELSDDHEHFNPQETPLELSRLVHDRYPHMQCASCELLLGRALINEGLERIGYARNHPHFGNDRLDSIIDEVEKSWHLLDDWAA